MIKLIDILIIAGAISSVTFVSYLGVILIASILRGQS